MLDTAHLVVRLILRTSDQQLIAALARLALQIVSDAGIAGILQIRDHQANGAGSPRAQPGGYRVGMVVVLAHDGHHFLNRLIADAVLLGFTVDHIAGGSPRDTCKTRDFIQFHILPLTGNRLTVTTNASTWLSRLYCAI